MKSLQVQNRDAKNNSESLRKGGFIPAVFYGFGKKSTPIAVNERDFLKVWKIAGESTTVTLKTPTGDVETLIHEIQLDPVTNRPIHADFLAIDINKAVRVKVPLVFTGISEAVKGGLGTLVKVLHEVEIEALPKNLPHSITVDISKLVTVEDQVLIKDLTLPAGVSILNNGDEVVAAIALQKEEVVEVAPVDLTQIEVMKKGKKEEEGAEAAPAAGEKKEKK